VGPPSSLAQPAVDAVAVRAPGPSTETPAAADSVRWVPRAPWHSPQSAQWQYVHLDAAFVAGRAQQLEAMLHEISLRRGEEDSLLFHEYWRLNNGCVPCHVMSLCHRTPTASLTGANTPRRLQQVLVVILSENL
jgi:hypothetical protein